MIITLFCLPLHGQNRLEWLQFDTVSWDFGDIKEAEGSVFHTFHFVNASKKTLQIGRVMPSCDCVSALTVPQSLDPDQIDEITLRLSPDGSNGPVNRYVDIYTTDGAWVAHLVLRANVLVAELSMAEQFPFPVTTGLRASAKTLAMGYIPLGGKASGRISFYNTSTRDIDLQVRLRAVSPYLSLRAPKVLKPGESASVALDFSIPDNPSSYGVREETLEVLAPGIQQPFEITASFICIDLPDKSAAKAPDMILSPSLVPLKKTLITRRYEGEARLENRGNADLHIRSVETENEVEINLAKGETLSLGAHKTIKVKAGTDRFSVFIITDDPARPLKEIRFIHHKY